MNVRDSRLLSVAMLATTLLFSASRSSADDFSWAAPTNGSFQNPLRWTPNGVPGAADRALFDLADQTPFTVNLTTDAVTDQLIVRNGSVSLDLDGQNYELNLLKVGDVATFSPSLLIAGGSMSSPVGCQGMYIAHGDNTSGALTISGEDTVLDLDVNVAMGHGSTGSLTIRDGAKLNSALVCVANVAWESDSNASVLISGTGSRWTHTTQMWFAHRGQAVLTIEDGGHLKTTDPAGYGQNGTGHADVTVTGAGSLWEATEFTFLGDGGSANILIENSGQAQFNGYEIGRTAESVADVTIDGIGSTIANTGVLFVGGSGSGSLTLQNGGSATNLDTFVGAAPGSTGQVLVTGSNSNLTMSGLLRIGSQSEGTVTVLDDGRIAAEIVVIAANGTLKGNGVVQSDLTNGGQVRPGNSAGILSVEGTYSQSSAGALYIEIGGTSVGSQYDKLFVTGGTALAGSLAISLVNGFMPTDGQSFQILQCGSRTGQFSTVTGASLGNGRTFRLNYSGTGLTITAVSIQGLTISPAHPSVYQGYSVELAALADVTGGDVDVTTSANWQSDNPLIASVSDGVVSGVSPGVTTIRATYEGFEAVVPLNVIELPPVLPNNPASMGAGGVPANGDSYEPAISADGRYVAYHSDATNLIVGDSNGKFDVFVWDRQTGETERVSKASTGAEGNGDSARPAISADGRYVAFDSTATNLVTNDTNNATDVFLHDRQTGQTTRVSVDNSGNQANSFSQIPAISGNGRYAAFESAANNLVPNDTNIGTDIFVFDIQTNHIERASLDVNGAQFEGRSARGATVSGDGRFVGFLSFNSSFTASNVYIRDRQVATTELVSVSSAGVVGNGPGGFKPGVSDDGRFVAFSSFASNLVLGDTNNASDVFVRDRFAGTTVRASLDNVGSQLTANSFAARLSPAAEFLSFYSLSSNIVPCRPQNGFRQVYLRDLIRSKNHLISRDLAGAMGNANSSQNEVPAITPDGRYVVFGTDATNILVEDTNNRRDIVIVDRQFQLPLLRGDMNCDCATSVLDIQSFVTALLDEEAYETQFGYCYRSNADLNADGAIDGADVSHFTALLLQP